MRRLIVSFAALCGLLTCAAALPVTQARAADTADTADTARSAGQRWALKSQANGAYVTVEANGSGNQQGKLRAHGDTAGPLQQFTLHTGDKGGTVSLRSDATGLFVSAEIKDAGSHSGMLRTRGTRIGTWEKFQLVPQADGTFALKSGANDTYVSAEINGTGADQGLLRARSDRVGAWERFAFERVDSASVLPAPAAPRAEQFHVMTWNVCGNNNTQCANAHTGADKLTAELVSRLRPTADGPLPDAVFLQEFCEKHTKPVEQKLEQATGRGWNVFFAPIHYNAGPLKAQKQCDTAGDVDRGAYGIGLAVPDESSWFRRYDLTSPDTNLRGDRTEQRTALCAALPSRALLLCTTHFSAGGPAYDDADGSYRRAQAAELLRTVEQPGYRAVFGGDFNVVPPDAAKGESRDVLEPVYAKYRECAQLGDSGAPRDGRATIRDMKIDYIFAPKNAPFTACSLSPRAEPSDHHTLYGTVSLPGV
ncbi:endonuclease/exonuclease/phosphatase family protein [Streptomyces sp. NPDC059788]|uniref:endonuclease/exonuclease/phosphatase family protein n=1 Tax=Streptomyces sp. NPDC059788 TaxID=3346948 RepID=UPI00366188A3